MRRRAERSARTIVRRWRRNSRIGSTKRPNCDVLVKRTSCWLGPDTLGPNRKGNRTFSWHHGVRVCYMRVRDSSCSVCLACFWSRRLQDREEAARWKYRRRMGMLLAVLLSLYKTVLKKATNGCSQDGQGRRKQLAIDELISLQSECDQ